MDPQSGKQDSGSHPTGKLKRKKLKRMKIAYGTYGTTVSVLTLESYGSQKENRDRKGQKTYLKK